MSPLTDPAGPPMTGAHLKSQGSVLFSSSGVATTVDL